MLNGRQKLKKRKKLLQFTQFLYLFQHNLPAFHLNICKNMTNFTVHLYDNLIKIKFFMKKIM